MIVLDTNVISALIGSNPDERVGRWLDDMYDMELFTTSITAAELLFGVERMPPGKRRVNTAKAVEQVLTVDFEGRILPFDETAAVQFARLTAYRQQLGRPIEAADAMIAAIAATYPVGVVVTGNVKDFVDTGIQVINPWELDPGGRGY